LRGSSLFLEETLDRAFDPTVGPPSNLDAMVARYVAICATVRIGFVGGDQQTTTHVKPGVRAPHLRHVL
jgi:hypothetical protein